MKNKKKEPVLQQEEADLGEKDSECECDCGCNCECEDNCTCGCQDGEECTCEDCKCESEQSKEDEYFFKKK